MLHRQRWTLQKIAQRLELITPLVYRHQVDLPPFHFLELKGPTDPTAVSVLQIPHSEIKNSWQMIEPIGWPATDMAQRSAPGSDPAAPFGAGL